MSFSPPEQSPRPVLEAARRRRMFWMIGMATLLLLMAAVARPAYRWGKAWRGRALAAEAEPLIEAKKWEDAVGKARAAYQLAPDEPATLRALAHFYSGVGAANAADFWEKLLVLPAATREDRRQAARFALQFNRLELAQAQIAILLKEEPNSVNVLELAVKLALQKQDRSTALRAIERLLFIDPKNADAHLSQARLFFSSAAPDERAEGRRALQRLAKTGDPTALEALAMLATDPALTPEEMRALADALEAHPQATIEHHLAAASLRIRADPQNRAALFEQTLRRYREGEPGDLAALGRWTLQQGEPARTAELISEAAANSRQDLLLIRVDALAALNRWSEVKAALENEKIALDPVYREVFLARASMELGEKRAAEAHWGRAFTAAGRTPRHLGYIAQYAAKSGNSEIAEKAWRQLALQPAWVIQANLTLIPLLEAQGKTRELRAVMKELGRLNPTDPAPRNDAAYLDVLLGENLTASIQLAEQLVREHPDRLAYRTTLALARLRAGDPAAARAIYQGLGIPWDKAPASARAVYAAVLAANGQRDEAKTAATSIPLDALKPEERALLEKSGVPLK